MNRNHFCNWCSLAVLSLSAGCATASNSNVDAGLGSADTGLSILVLDAGHDSNSIIIVQMDSGQTILPTPDAGHDATVLTTDGGVVTDAAGTDGATVDAGHPDSATPADAGTDSSTPASDAAAPTTCTEARGAAGCCAADGLSYYYCKADAGTVTHTTCTGTKVCGWESSKGYYTCTATPEDAGSANPSTCE